MLVKAIPFASVFLWTAVGSAQFAVSPHTEDAPPFSQEPGTSKDESVIRASVGPALRLGPRAAGGLATGLNIGRQSGLHLSAIWTQASRSDTSAQYGADLWLAFSGIQDFRPLLGAGAALVREPATRVQSDTGSTDIHQFAIATVRAGLEYLVPLQHTDARISLEGVGAIPAVKAEDHKPWATLVSSIHLGF